MQTALHVLSVGHAGGKVQWSRRTMPYEEVVGAVRALSYIDIRAFRAALKWSVSMSQPRVGEVRTYRRQRLRTKDRSLSPSRAGCAAKHSRTTLRTSGVSLSSAQGMWMVKGWQSAVPTKKRTIFLRARSLGAGGRKPACRQTRYARPGPPPRHMRFQSKRWLAVPAKVARLSKESRAIAYMPVVMSTSDSPKRRCRRRSHSGQGRHNLHRGSRSKSHKILER